MAITGHVEFSLANEDVNARLIPFQVYVLCAMEMFSELKESETSLVFGLQISSACTV